MKTYQSHLLPKIFSDLHIEEGDVLFIHSSILSFGFPSDIKIENLPQILYEELRKKIGPSGTIVVPAFNFDFCKGNPFNKQETPSKNMGAFSEYVRKLSQAKRSSHPMQSIVAVGKQADYLTEKDTSSAFDSEGAFDRLIKLKVKVLLLGAGFGFNSVFHWVEQKHEVPYRYWKDFSGLYIDREATKEKTYRMFVRDLKLNPQLELSFIKEKLLEEDKLQSRKLGLGYIQIYRLYDFIEIAEEAIRSNPLFFIK